MASAVIRDPAVEKTILKHADPVTAGATQVRAFREALLPFGLDRFVLRDEPKRILHLPDGRILAEFRTMPLPVWYPETLKQLEAAGFEVVTFLKKYSKHAPCPMYYVRSVQEIWRENHGNQ